MALTGSVREADDVRSGLKFTIVETRSMTVRERVFGAFKESFDLVGSRA